MADIVIGNKSDLYLPDDRQKLHTYAQKIGRANASVLFTSNAELDLSILDSESGSSDLESLDMEIHAHHSNSEPTVLATDEPLPDSGCLKAENKGEGYRIVDWVFNADKTFQHDRLFSFLSGIDAERVKASITHLAPDQSPPGSLCPSRAPLPASSLCSIHRPSVAPLPASKPLAAMRVAQWRNWVSILELTRQPTERMASRL